MEVGRYMFSTLPKTLPAGLEKSRCVGRSGLGCVGTGAGAVGRFDEALSGALAPAPDCVAGVASCCCARLSGEPDASASMAAATARRRMPAFPRPLSPLKLALDWRLDCICFGSNTPVAYDCMIPLHEGLKHLRKDEFRVVRLTCTGPPATARCRQGWKSSLPSKNCGERSLRLDAIFPKMR